jgi:putative PIN family toxin of toxin-antitoxin system
MGKIQKVVVDTNVIISAFGWGGKPLQIMELLERGALRNCVSEHTLKELIATLAYPKLGFSHATQTNILEFVLAYRPDPDGVSKKRCYGALLGI